MKLSETWFVEGQIDFELQKYRLLAYLQDVNQYFNQTKLYPALADIIFHYNNLHSFKANKKFIQEQFPKRMDKLDAEKLEIIYERMLADDELMQELEDIIDYALTKIKGTIESGTELYEFIEQQTQIEPVGILPLYKKEGYMLLRYGQYSEVRAYAYTISLFEHKDAKYKGMKLNYVNSFEKNIINTYEHIKREIIRSIPEQPNPAVYMVETKLAVPFNETLLPIAKRMLVKQVEENS